MKEMLLVLGGSEAMSRALNTIAAAGGRVLQQYGTDVLVVQGDDQMEQTLGRTAHVQGVFTGVVPQHHVSHLDFSGSLGVSAWNERHSSSFSDAKANRPGAGLSWGHPDFEREG